MGTGSMAITVACPACAQTYKVHEKLLGRRAACRKCGRQFVIPAPAQRTRPANLDPGHILLAPDAPATVAPDLGTRAGFLRICHRNRSILVPAVSVAVIVSCGLGITALLWDDQHVQQSPAVGSTASDIGTPPLQAGGSQQDTAVRLTTKDDPRTLLQDAVQLIRQDLSDASGDLVNRSAILKDAAAAQARLGFGKDALSTLQHLQRTVSGTGADGLYDDAQLVVAQAFVDAGNVEQALQLLPELNPDFQRPKLRASLIVATTHQRGIESARREFRDLTTELSADREILRLHAPDLIQAAGQAGLTADALQLIHDLRQSFGDRDANQLLAKLARIRAEWGDTETALDLLEHHNSPDSLFFGTALARIGEELARAGKLQQALAAANMTPRPFSLRVVLAIAEWHAAKGNQESMRVAFRVAEDNLELLTEAERSLAREWLVESYANAGLSAEARAYADMISGPDSDGKRIMALAHIATAEKRHGRRRQSEETLSQAIELLIKNLRNPGIPVIESVAEAAASTGTRDQLLEAVRATESPLLQARLLIAIAGRSPVGEFNEGQ